MERSSSTNARGTKAIGNRSVDIVTGCVPRHIGVSEFVWKEYESKCEKCVYCPCEFGQWVKDWNFEGSRHRLRCYLPEERLPSLTSVFQRYSGHLIHAVKLGHTSIFYDLEDYYETFLSGNMRVNFIRIQRNRIHDANSFVAQSRRTLRGHQNSFTERFRDLSRDENRHALFEANWWHFSG